MPINTAATGIGRNTAQILAHLGVAVLIAEVSSDV